MRQFFGELGVLPGGFNKVQQLLAYQILQHVSKVIEAVLSRQIDDLEAQADAARP